MGVAVASAGELSQEAQQVRQYLRIVAPLSAVFAPVMALAAWFAPVPIMLLLASLVTVNSLLQLAGYWLAGRNRVDASLLVQASGLWLLALAISLGGELIFALVAGVSLLAVVIAVPYVSVGMLLRISIIGTGVVAVGSTFLLTGPALTIDVADSIKLPIIGAGMTAIVSAIGVALWHTRFTLDKAASGIAATNRALRASEESLEDRVEERTRELERSQLEIRRARDEALAASRHKSAFLANMSHELRTPLNAIIGFSEVLGEGVFGELEGKQAEYVTDIHQSGHHLLALINDILDLSKIEAGRLELAPARFDLALTCQNALIGMREKAAREGVDLRDELGAGPLPITADERRLKQVLGNLLSNAIKYTGEGGSVTVGLRAQDGQVELSVRDTGIGISVEDQAVIFEAFQQAAVPDYTHAHAGTGVGLALSQRLAELHGGSITVESELGRGSTFRVRLPLEPSGSPA